MHICAKINFKYINMNKSYSTLIQSIKNRQNPQNDRLVESKTFSNLSDIPSDIKKYIKIAMEEVDTRYTQITLEAGETVKQHLQRELTNVTYKYQGSVMTQTHIRGYSDIDLLTICNKFYTCDMNAVDQYLTSKPSYYSNEYNTIKNFKEGFSLYQGNTLDDLKELRLNNENILKRIYSICNTSHSKAIKITNLNLHRDVDIVTASWYDNLESIKNNQENAFRGIQIYDKDKNERCPVDYPFLSIDRINKRSSETQGRLKKMIRFLKNIKADSDKTINLSSFDINAICYSININEYYNTYYMDLVRILFLHLYKIYHESDYANSIVSVDGNEYIFRYDSSKLIEVKKLLDEVFNIYNDLNNAQ